MGVAFLQAYPVPADKTAPQVIDLLTKRLAHLGAVHTGQFLVDCETYYSQHQQGKTLNVMHNSEYPATVFSVLESGPKSIIFSSDTLFDLLLLKLSNVYMKHSKKIESKGPRFEVGGDFRVKLGVVSVAGSFKGILIEVEYLPCLMVEQCRSLLQEFMQGFLGSVVQKGSNTPSSMVLAKKPPPEPYSPNDTILQYLEHFHQLRKNVQMLGPQQQQQQQQQQQNTPPQNPQMNRM